MNRIFIILVTLVYSVSIYGNDIPSDGNLDKEKKESNFHLGLDIQTKYIWRGMEMMTEESAPVIFPQINYQYKGFYVYAMGGYSLNGHYSEVDLGVSYTYQWLTIGINDYYYPSTTAADEKYFEFDKDNTGHWLEAVITVSPDKIPVYLTLSNFFYGADKKTNGEQAYSTYIELGTYYDFLNSNRLALTVGAALNESCYNGYDHGFGICNIELKYTHNISFKNGWSLPVNVAYIVNPIREKSFVNFSTSFAF